MGLECECHEGDELNTGPIEEYSAVAYSESWDESVPIAHLLRTPPVEMRQSVQQAVCEVLRITWTIEIASDCTTTASRLCK